MDRWLALVLTLGVFAPQGQGSVSGKVTDSYGGVIPGVTVTATANGKSQTAVTNSRGEYAIAGLDRGTYKVTGALAGFNDASCAAVEIGNSLAHCDLPLRVGGPPVPQSDPRYQAFLAAEAKWRAAAIRSYEMSVSVGCFCPFDTTPQTVSVVDGVPEKAPNDGKFRHRYDTVEKIFTRIRQGLDSGHEVINISYDPDNGIPTVVYLDMSSKGEDDDVAIRVTSFQKIKSE